MKRSLLASTALGALMAGTSFAHAEGWGVRFFGGYSFSGDDGKAGPFGISTGLMATSPGPTGVFNTTIFSYMVPFSSVFLSLGFATIASASGTGVLDLDQKGGFVLGLAVGYGWDNGLILELEGAYRKNDLDLGGSGLAAFSGAFVTTFLVTFDPGIPYFSGATGIYGSVPFSGSGAITPSGDGDVSTWSFMANVWYEFDTGGAIKPFIGVGAGIAGVDIDGKGTINVLTSLGSSITTGFEFDGDVTGFAWQAGAGIGFEVGENRQLTLEYRYFNGPSVDKVTGTVAGFTGTLGLDYDYESHEVMVGFKSGF